MGAVVRSDQESRTDSQGRECQSDHRAYRGHREV